MTDFDPTLNQVQAIQAAFDVENFSGADTPEGKRRHILWHLQILCEKLAMHEVSLEKVPPTAKSDIVTEEIIPDLQVFAAMLAEVEDVSLAEVYKKRLQTLAERNDTPGSDERAIQAGLE